MKNDNISKKRILPKAITAKYLKETLTNFAPDSEITFGSSTCRKRPLIFNRFKWRGENSLHIELNELERDDPPMAEHGHRRTVKDFLEYLEDCPDDTEVFFGCTIDAVPLEFESITTAVSFNLTQTEEPEWFVVED